MTMALVTVLVVVPMLVETTVSSRNEARLRAAGAVEPPGDVYRIMVVAYPAAFVAMVAEGALRGAESDAWLRAGLAVFVIAKALKYWAIGSLGPRWTFRVLVPPGSARTLSGPYRWFAHPNYVAVAGELVGVALAAHAVVSGPAAVGGFTYLMLRRIRVEEAALGQA